MDTTRKTLEMNSISLFRLSRSSALRLLAIATCGFVFLLCRTDSCRGEPLSSCDPFAALQKRLIQDGFEEPHIRSLYSRPEVTFEQGGVSAYFLHREAVLNYDQFLTPSSINQAFNYLGQHQEALKKAQSVYGVEGEIITAIILVETRFGTYIGKRLVLNTLSTLAALGDKDSRENLWHVFLKDKAERSKQQFDAWALRKSKWAYSELKAFINYTKAQRLDPVSVHGSFAGALGIAQFLPSSVLRFAKDGNGDGQINLFDHADAIESIASYLNQHGWRPSLKRSEALRLLLHYNNSTYYAEAILKAAERLEKLRAKQHSG